MFELDGIKIFWLGHASFKIKAVNKIIYIDPYNITEDEKADFILVTHEHFDHFDPKSIKAISDDKTIVIGPPTERKIKTGETLTFDNIKIEAVEAYNVEKSFHPRGLGVGYLIEIDKKTIYHAGDTDFIPEMKNLAGKIDVALLPIGGTYTMDIKDAVEAVKTIKPKYVIPMHYGTLKETMADPEEFKKLVNGFSQVKILNKQPE
ncbi:MBL fold metallo-hydrolase [bacterium]|nr:MBL fold metallo-hydrolase [bacterium]